MKRILLTTAKVIAAVSGVALLVACAFVIWVAGTESGLQFVWQRVEPRLPEAIGVEVIQGRLAGPLELRGVSFRTPTLEVRVERAELEWVASALPSWFAVERLHLRGVDVVQLPAANAPPLEDDGASPLPERIELPFGVDVDEAMVEDLRYRSSPEAEALLIDRVAFGGRLDEHELLVRELAVSGPLFDATARAQVVPRDSYETEGELDWVVRYGDYPDAIGSARFSGNLAALTIEPSLDAPYNASAKVVVRQPLTALRLDGTVTLLAVHPAELGAGPPNSTVTSELSFEGTPDNLALNGTVKLSAEAFDEIDAELHVRYTARALQIERLDVAQPASGAALQASGRVALGPELTLDVHGAWSGLQWPLRDRPLGTSESGTLELRGTLENYVLSLDAAVASATNARANVRVAGTGNSEMLRLEQIEIEALDGRVDGRGDVTWRPEIGASLELTARDLDPRALVSEWPGRLGATLRAVATIEDQNVAVRVDELTVDGELRGRPIEARARGEYSLDTLRLETLALQSGATRIDASGTAGREVALQWRIDSPDLADVWPSLAGQLMANGELNGPRMQPHARVDAHGQALSYMASEVGELSLAADVDLAGRAESRLDLSLSAARVQGTPLEQLELHGTGNAERHELQLTATSDLGEARIGLAGVIAQPWRPDFVWTFDLSSATLTHASFPPWELRTPSSGRVSAARAELARTCWQSGATDLCVEGMRQPDLTEGRFSVSALPFAYFAAALAEPVRIEGELSAEGAFEQRSGGAPLLNVELESSLGRLVSEDLGEFEPYALSFGPIDGRVTTEDDRMTGELTVPLEQHGALELEARVGQGAGAAFAERSLDGSLRVAIDDLDFVSHVLGTLQDTGGTLGGEMRLSGTVGEPRVDGRIALDNGKATVRATNVVLEDLGLVVTSDGSGEITIEADGRSGGGSVRAEGTFALAAGGPLGRITVKGERFEVIDTQDAQVLVSPDLAFAVAPDRLELTGIVTVPQARLTPRENEQSVVAASADQVIVTEENEQGRAMGRPLHANVELRLGDEVDLRGYGLEGRLGGGLKIVEVPGEPITGSGELHVEKGIYEAYGQKLEVGTGRLLFAGGPIEQPGLDIEAVRRPAEGILVGARVRGTLKSPELTVFSQPTMPQQEQLSYLVLGRPLQSASASESSAMSRAALALGLKGGNFVSERINENLGLDEFGIQTDPTQPASEASFVIGKYLSPSLYVSYGIGIFEPVNTLKLRYTISRRWQLVTESSSEASGGDVIYNIERK